jgi:hypothetical protein
MDLSRRRRRILDAIVPSVVPSASGTPTFRKIDASWAPNAGYTTCGGLPAYVSGRLGLLPAGLATRINTGGGLAGMRNAGIATGSWVHNGAMDRRRAVMAGGQPARPKPGDFYLLCSGSQQRHETGCNCIAPVKPEDADKYKGATIEHVGIVVSAEGTLWRTADAGQGNQQVQLALYVWRQFNPMTQQITGESDKFGKPMRRLCGWIDVDRFPFLT